VGTIALWEAGLGDVGGAFLTAAIAESAEEECGRHARGRRRARDRGEG
jgi:hypothetical protein